MKVVIKNTKRILDDFFKVDKSVLQYEKFDGTLSNEIIRLNFDRGDSVSALLVDRSREVIILVKQFRFPVFTKDEKKAWLLEIVAGTIEQGNSPEETIIREITEESGYLINRLETITEIFPSPGGSNEKIYIYYAEVKQDDLKEAGGGIASEGEDIQVIEIPFEKAFQMLESREFVDAKTIIALQWFKSFLQK
ncbi:hypothetical protein B6I21_09675 [candidate division KSB1 bacterium 4572_119]|nr:MAG: hypothetical protein B6I21_09675 [candidate division KSB1 bacterium 4572_119]